MARRATLIKYASAVIAVATIVATRPSFGQSVRSCSSVFDRKRPLEPQPQVRPEDELIVTEFQFLFRHLQEIKEDIGEWRDGVYMKRTLGGRRWFWDDARVPVGRSTAMRSQAEAAVEEIFRIYRERGIVSEETIAAMRSLDGRIPIENLGFIIFSDQATLQPRVAIRIVDVSEKHKRSKGVRIPLPIEMEYPFLILPERAKGLSKLIELGRLGRQDSVEGDLRVLLTEVARHLVSTHPELAEDLGASSSDPTIYVEATAAGARLYQREYGFEIAFGPKDLRVPKGQPARYILRIPAREFVARFGTHRGHLFLRKSSTSGD
jgi:hypothetical protein